MRLIPAGPIPIRIRVYMPTYELTPDPTRNCPARPKRACLPPHIDSIGFSTVIVLLYYCCRYCNCSAQRPIFIELLIAAHWEERTKKSNNTRQFISRYFLVAPQLEWESQKITLCIFYNFIFSYAEQISFI